jgi:hypothetical protein
MPLSLNLNTRATALTLAALLGISTVWVLGSELPRPALDAEFKFPISVSPQDIKSARLASSIAASIGFIRGDLWSERVLVDSANVIDDQDVLGKTPQDAEAVRAAAERALLLRPLDSRVWLILAILSSNAKSEAAKEQMKMSYYTGPNDKSVIGHRLKYVVRLLMLDDQILRESVRREIRAILLRAPELRSVIMAAYREARPQDREFIETTTSATDPQFAAALRAARQ